MLKVATSSPKGKPIVSFPENVDYSIFRADSPDLAVTEQLPVAVYWGANGHIVIAQPGGCYGDEIERVFLEPENVQRVIDALTKLLGGADTANEVESKEGQEQPVAQLDLEVAISEIGGEKKEVSKKEPQLDLETAISKIVAKK